jgi:starch synthase (maltosyl-transferring)
VNRNAAGGPRRVIVEHLRPEIDGGRFPIKRTIGEVVSVTVDMFADGHDLLSGVLRYRHGAAGRRPAAPALQPDTQRRPGSAPDSLADPAYQPSSASSDALADPASWTEVPLTALDNDSWSASFTVSDLGEYEYTVEGWIDRFGSWLKGLTAKADAGQDVSSELLEGAELVQDAAAALSQPHDENDRLLEIADILRSARPQAERLAAAREPRLRALMDSRPDRSASTTYDRVLRVVVDPVRARYGAWYEMFPRSCTPDPWRSGTFREAEARLPEVAAMGFDVVYLPPVHPIGRSHRKGRNNSLTPEPGEPGSPWAIGSEEGGHTAIEPGLGTIDDFDRFVATASHLGMQVALDIAFQASPDHPWVREHPEWFKHRPDGSIKYAENPPKKYQDIYPLNFDSADWRSLWAELRDVFLFWVSHGVTIFRVDNPHTKSFRFWDWCIAEIKRAHPETIFLSEAFTRPKLMQYLAKVGFSQSYTYFTWRNTAGELREYVTQLTRTEVHEYLRPNFFANTPDILHEYLQHGGRPAFEVRLVLAATLAASYGIYSGFELCENVAVRPGSEEYLDSEKYQIRIRNWNQPGNLNELIARVNDIRRAHPALQQNATLQFHATDNAALLWYSKSSGGPQGPPLRNANVSGGPAAFAKDMAPKEGPLREGDEIDRVFVVTNTDPHHMQHGWLEMPIGELGIAPDAQYVVQDLLDEAEYTWSGAWNYVKLDPAERMAHIFVVRR